MLTSITTPGAGWYVALSNPSMSDLDWENGDRTYQDYLVRVPVPGAVLLGILGLGAAGMKLRKSA